MEHFKIGSGEKKSFVRMERGREKIEDRRRLHKEIVDGRMRN